MNIRAYETADRLATIALWTLVFGDSNDHNSPERSLDRKLEAGNELLFASIENSEVVGAVMGGYDGHRGWVYSLAVHPEHRRKGIATNLIQSLERQLEKLGCPKINLQVRSTNQEVLAFYESLGYATEERISMGKRL